MSATSTVPILPTAGKGIEQGRGTDRQAGRHVVRERKSIGEISVINEE